MTQPIKLTVNINPAAAVRQGLSNCGQYTVQLTDAAVARLTDEQREYLAKHLEQKTERSEWSHEGFNHSLSLDTDTQLAVWTDQTLGQLLTVRATAYSAWIDRVVVAHEACLQRYRDELAAPRKLNHNKRYETIQVRHPLPYDLHEAIKAENDWRSAQNAIQAEIEKDEAARIEAQRGAWTARVHSYLEPELVARQAAGYDLPDEWDMAYDVAVVQALGLISFKAHPSGGNRLTDLTPEQFARLRQVSMLGLTGPELASFEFYPVELDGHFAIELDFRMNGVRTYAVYKCDGVDLLDSQLPDESDDDSDDV